MTFDSKNLQSNFQASKLQTNPNEDLSVCLCLFLSWVINFTFTVKAKLITQLKNKQSEEIQSSTNRESAMIEKIRQIDRGILCLVLLQNVLCCSKFFVPDQTCIYILWQSRTFCARQKDNLHSVKLVFVPAQKFLKRH